MNVSASRYRYAYITYIIYIYIYLERVCPLCLGLNPPKEGPFHSKQGSLGFQVYISRQYSLKSLIHI